MELYYTFSVLIVLTSLFAYFNHRFLKLPATIGIMIIALISSVVLVAFGKFLPHTFAEAKDLIREADLEESLMGAMLNFLLFAGAIHVKFSDLKNQKKYVITFSTISVIISTFVVGGLMYFILDALKIGIPFIQCLLFGALISPTDPIAVLGILKKAGVPKSIETKIAGESLFNDGVAVVMFVSILNLAQAEHINISLGEISWLIIKEAVGGGLIGVILGYSASKAMKKVDDYKLEVLITLAIVMGGYLLAKKLHVSPPIAMVVAGLFIGNYARTYVMSDITKDYVDKFWELLDEIMNAILFMLIGFELLIIENLNDYWIAGTIAILVVLFARYISIALPSLVIPFIDRLDKKSTRILVWGGLRGGVSVALAMSINPELNKELILSITYFVVVFSIVVQGLTIGKVTNRK